MTDLDALATKAADTIMRINLSQHTRGWVANLCDHIARDMPQHDHEALVDMTVIRLRARGW